MAQRDDGPMTQRKEERSTESAPVPAEDASSEGQRSEQIRGEAFSVSATTAAAGAFGAAMLLPVLPVVGAVSAGVAVVGAGVAMISGVAPLRTAREIRAARSLRKKAFVEGVVVPLANVQSPEGECCAFDHVVRRCDACDCVRPCGARARYRWEERLAGRFLVRGEGRVVSIDRADVHFETTLREKAASRFHRLDAGERVRVRGDFEEATELPDDMRAVLSSHRELPRVLVPREATAVLIEKLA